MTQLATLVEAFETARDARDQARMTDILERVPSGQLDAFMDAVELGEDATRKLDVSRLGDELARQGMSPAAAGEFASLSIGGLAEWIEARMAARGISPESVVARAEAQTDGLDPGLADAAVRYLEEISDGRRTSMELDSDAIGAIARALDTTDETVDAVVERDRSRGG